MMKELVRILREGELDRETKLRIIEIVSINQDDALVKDLVSLLQEWDTADNKMEEDMRASLRDVEKKYEATVDRLDDEREQSLEKLEDEVEKSDDISALKKSILKE